MGSTITCGKHAAAFEINGKKMYALFERTYEKNCYPHTPTWHAAVFGGYETVMKWVFEGAAACQSGMLQNTKGGVMPEKYLSDWASKLKAPVAMPDYAVNLFVGKDHSDWRAPIEADSDDHWSRNIQKTTVLARLRAAGFGELADVFDSGGSVNRRLYEIHDVLEVIYGHGGIWRVMPDWVMPGLQSERLPELGPDARKGSVICQDWTVWRLNGNDHLVIRGDGSRSMSWLYSVVMDFIVKVGYPMEMGHTGSATAAITAFRERASAVPILQGATRISIRRSVEADKYQVKRVDDVAQGLGIADSDGRAPDEFTTTLEALKTTDHGLFWLQGVRWQDVIWHLPATADQAEAPCVLAA